MVFKFLLVEFPIQMQIEVTTQEKCQGHTCPTEARALPSPETSTQKLQDAREPQSWQNQRLLGALGDSDLALKESKCSRPHHLQ